MEGKYSLYVEDTTYPVHAYVFDGDQHWTENQVFGDENDVATKDDYAKNMVIVKINGDLTIDNGVTVRPYHTAYGGPKEFTLYVTGKLTNNGTIDNSHGAKAEGEDVYLWKNTDGSYEYVPASGGTSGVAGAGRQTGGGSSTGTSYSGGTGSGLGLGGGLIVIYASGYENNGIIIANGSDGPIYGAGGGSINIFYNSLISTGKAIVNGGTVYLEGKAL